MIVENGRQNLSKWCKQSLAGGIEIWKMQDKYLGMNTGQLFDYLRKNYVVMSGMIPDEYIGNKEIGKVIQCASERLEMALDLQDFEAAQNEENMLFNLLVLPFACWIMDTEYIPEQKFLDEIHLLEVREEMS